MSRLRTVSPRHPAGDRRRPAGIDRRDAYVTNVVKHFRFKQRGKRRIHQTQERVHVNACRPWLEAELTVVKPQARSDEERAAAIQAFVQDLSQVGEWMASRRR